MFAVYSKLYKLDGMLLVTQTTELLHFEPVFVYIYMHYLGYGQLSNLLVAEPMAKTTL